MFVQDCRLISNELVRIALLKKKLGIINEPSSVTFESAVSYLIEVQEFQAFQYFPSEHLHSRLQHFAIFSYPVLD